MTALPTIPSFTDLTAPSLTDLTNLSYAVSFTADCDVRPTWHFYRTATMSLTANAWNLIPTNQTAFDSDGVKGSGGAGAVIVTRGYYAVEGCVDVSVTSVGQIVIGAFLWTAGASNPHFTAGSTLVFGGKGGNSTDDNSSNSAYTFSDLCPRVCYPGDTIQPQVWTSFAFTLKYNSNDAFNEGRFVPNFTGIWVGQGT
jgi:hypothetical protein